MPRVRGGVSAGLKLWLRADAGTTLSGTTVTGWADQSVNGNNLTQYTGYTGPTFTNNVANYNPGFLFSNNFLYRAAPGVFFPLTTYNNVNYYVVYIATDSLSFHWLIYQGYNGFNRFSHSMDYGTDNTGNMDLTTSNRLNYTPTNKNTPLVISFLNSNTHITGSDYSLLYNNSNLMASGTSITSPPYTGPTNNLGSSFTGQSVSYPLQLGDNKLSTTDANGNPFVGYINEVILDTAANSLTQRQQIESYLGLKYGITLTSGGLTSGYLNSGGTSVFSTGSDGTTFWNQVIGIARDSASGGGGLYQRQSHQSDDSTRLYLGTLAAVNQKNSSTFTNNLSYVVMGNNKGHLCSDVGDNINKAPALGLDHLYRLDREWKLQVTGAASTTAVTDNFNMDVTLSSCAWGSSSTHAATDDVGDLGLLVNTSSDLTTGTFVPNYSTYGSTMNISLNTSTGIVTIGNLNAGLAYYKSASLKQSNTPLYFTLASISPSVLVVKIISFTARAVTDQVVSLQWKVSAEPGVQSFVIQRSQDGIHWTDLGTMLPTISNSVMEQQYSENDYNPISGHSFYRIGVLDASGNTVYSVIQPVEMEQGIFSIDNIVPNPFVDGVSVSINLPERGIIFLLLLDVYGKTLQKVWVHGDMGPNIIPLNNLGQLPAGLYFVEAGFDKQVLTKKMIKRN